jgi:hypothetical protein
MFARWFLAHPRSVGESYFEHLAMAGGFAVRLLGAGLACLIHALIPALFQTTASDTVLRLHGVMAARRTGVSRPRNGPAPVIAPAD